MHSNKSPLKKSGKYLLALLVPALMVQLASAEGILDAQGNLPNVQLEAQTATINKTADVGKTVIGSQQMSERMVSNSKDLVRYETGVTVVETGRMGSSGYSIRGVDENRVAVVVDGLQQSETLASEGFKELFAGYGNFNNSRNSVEFETLKRAKILKGADSVSVGSGALGGSVAFETKDARDFLGEKDYHIGYKIGYATVDNQLSNSVTLAGRHKWFDALAVLTKRDGYETENYGYEDYDDAVQGRAREKADPYEITKESALVKLAVSPNDEHRVTFTSDIYEHRAKGQDLSYTLNAFKTGFGNSIAEKDSRHTDDFSKRKYFALTYENTQSTPFWDSLKITAAKQKIDNRARTDDYCDNKDPSFCEKIYNPFGFQLKDGKIVDGDGQDIVVKDGYTFIKNGEDVKVGFNSVRLRDEWFDCSIFDCKKGINGFDIRWDDSYTKQTYTPKTYQFDTENTITTPEGKTFAKVLDATSYDYYLKPNNPGFLNRAYKDRTLSTDTKQINLDAQKFFGGEKFSSHLAYGGVYSISDKEMVNKEGYYAFQEQWWAKRFLGFKPFSKELHTCDTAYLSTKNALNCPTFGEPTSFLVPVRTKTGALYLTNKMHLNDRVGLNVGYRYDNIHYQPRYEHGVSPRIPESMVNELFVPYVAPEGAPGPRPSSLSEFNYDYAAFNKALAEWNKKNEEFGPIVEKAKADNVKANFAYFAQPKKYSAHSYMAQLNIDPTDFLKLQYKYASGFRAPTSDEIYFTFKHPDFTILPNNDLKAEIAKTQELAITAHNNYGHITASAFQTKYDDFIDLKFLGTKSFKNGSGVEAQAQPHQLYQNVNRENAKVTGYELSTKLNAGALNSKLDGVGLNYKVAYQKGRYEGDKPLNAVQPLTHIASIAYDHPSGKFGTGLHLTHVRSKKAADTYDMYATSNALQPIQWRSPNYSVWDLTAYVKPTDKVRLQAGVYNLFDEKYTTWESARSIRPFGTSNRVNTETGAGLNRFLSPGRNVKIGAEFTF